MSLTSDPAFRDAVAALVDHYASDIRARATVDNADALDQAGHVTAAEFLRDTLEERASMSAGVTSGEATADGAPGRFRKKPVVIEAAQWFKNGDHPEDNCHPIGEIGSGELSEGAVVRYFRHPDVPGDQACKHCGKTMHVHGWLDTLEGGNDGAQMVCPGDWIITGVQGERYPCKPDIFEATYDAVQAQRVAVSE